MKPIAGIAAALCLTWSVPAVALSISNYTPKEMRQLEAQARAGDVDAMVDLGDAYAWGRAPGNGTDRASAIYWFGRAANLGNAKAQRALGDLHRDDAPRAFLWYQRAADKGDVLAQGRLAQIYETSPIHANYGMGHRWTLKAALQGDDSAVIRLQTLYVYKDEVVTFDAALTKLGEAADAGDPDAQSRLATILLMGLAGHEDKARARVLAEKAAAQNNPESLFSLYFLLPEEAKAESAAVLRRSADLGHVPAQFIWMQNYEPPEGVATVDDPNERMIFDWLRAAAEKGWPMAQWSLSGYYDRGHFVERDAAEAWKWRLVAQYLPYNRDNAWLGGNPWSRPVEHAWQAEGHRRADAWLRAHPLQYWQTED